MFRSLLFCLLTGSKHRIYTIQTVEPFVKRRKLCFQLIERFFLFISFFLRLEKRLLGKFFVLLFLFQLGITRKLLLDRVDPDSQLLLFFFGFLVCFDCRLGFCNNSVDFREIIFEFFDRAGRGVSSSLRRTLPVPPTSV